MTPMITSGEMKITTAIADRMFTAKQQMLTRQATDRTVSEGRNENSLLYGSRSADSRWYRSKLIRV